MKNNGIIKLVNVKFVINKDGKLVLILCNIELIVIDIFGCIKENYKVFYGVVFFKYDGDEVVVGEVVVNWDLYIMFVILEVLGCI